MNWLNSIQNDKIKLLSSTVQTGAELFKNLHQLKEEFGSQSEQATLQQGKNEITFIKSPSSHSQVQQIKNGFVPITNLHNGFSREQLNILAKESPTKLEEHRPQDGCTPLLCAVKRNDLANVVQLLAHGADFYAVDLSGNTALHHAVMAGSQPIVKLLLCFGADPNKENKNGVRVHSLKASSEIAELLTLIRMWEQKQDHLPDVTDKQNLELSMKVAREMQNRALRYQRTKSKEQRQSSVRLLSLDGGGIRGLVLVQMLIELERMAGEKDDKAKASRTFVQRNFDWIAGTSTGAILALALADGLSLYECLRLYLRMKDDVFNARIRPYSPEFIENFLKEQFGERKMSELKCGNIRVIVTASNAEKIPLELVLFRNYNSPFNHCTSRANNRVSIWKAARYSSAAPTYFSSVDGLMDGGLITNNPSIPLLKEINQLNLASQFNLIGPDNSPSEMAFLLSLGTGRIPEVEVDCVDVGPHSLQTVMQTFAALSNLKSMLVEQLAASDGEVVEVARMIVHSKSAPYFRLTPSLHADIQLDTVDNNILVEMLWTAKAYMYGHCADEVRQLLALMREFTRD